MPTLSASSSVFQLAFAVNAALPVLISDFEVVRNDAADTLLRKIKKYCPEFKLDELDRVDFVDFSFRSTRGLRHAWLITRLTIFVALSLCFVSLAALCWSAVKPDQQVSSGSFFAFVSATFILGPLVYFGQNRYLKWLNSYFN
jgi:hypothetical protein